MEHTSTELPTEFLVAAGLGLETVPLDYLASIGVQSRDGKPVAALVATGIHSRNHNRIKTAILLQMDALAALMAAITDITNHYDEDQLSKFYDLENEALAILADQRARGERQ